MDLYGPAWTYLDLPMDLLDRPGATQAEVHGPKWTCLNLPGPAQPTQRTSTYWSPRPTLTYSTYSTYMNLLELPRPTQPTWTYWSYLDLPRPT
eukprot:1393927-Amorphochlora_amoeboformis.AAC.1